MLILPMLTLAVGLLGAQTPQASSSPPSEHTAAKYLGEVRDYKPGNLLEVDIGDKRVKSYDLTNSDKTFEIDSGVAKGAKVDISETKDVGGREIVSVRLHR